MYNFTISSLFMEALLLFLVSFIAKVKGVIISLGVRELEPIRLSCQREIPAFTIKPTYCLIASFTLIIPESEWFRLTFLQTVIPHSH